VLLETRLIQRWLWLCLRKSGQYVVRLQGPSISKSMGGALDQLPRNLSSGGPPRKQNVLVNAMSDMEI
jgi:hypothetical protein